MNYITCIIFSFFETVTLLNKFSFIEIYFHFCFMYIQISSSRCAAVIWKSGINIHKVQNNFSFQKVLIAGISGKRLTNTESVSAFSLGLRTLCFAVAEISESDYQEWLDVYHRASTAIQNRVLKLEESYELIEKVCGAWCSFVGFGLLGGRMGWAEGWAEEWVLNYCPYFTVKSESLLRSNT